MRPIRTTESNFTFRGPTPDIADFPGKIDREDRSFSGVYKPTDEEREAIANGANLELTISQIPMPPVNLKVAEAVEEWGDDDLVCSNCSGVWLASRPDVGDNCNWCGHALYRPTEQRAEGDGTPE